MALPSIPAIEEEIRQVVELTAQHEELARNAPANEEVYGDLVFASETNTRSFMTIFQQLKITFNSAHRQTPPPDASRLPHVPLPIPP